MTKDQTPSPVVTREEVICWAREAGLPSDELYHPNLERFAALIASRVAAAAKAEEREVCARVCEDEDVAPTDDAVGVQQCIAAAIRARKENT